MHTSTISVMMARTRYVYRYVGKCFTTRQNSYLMSYINARKIQYLDTYFVPPDLGEERDGPGEVVEKETGALLPALGSVTS